METILEQFEVSTATVSTLLVFDFILDDEWLVRNIDGLAERGRNGMVRSNALCNETEIALDEGGGRFFDCPFANIRESFTTNGGLLGGLRASPPVIPSVGELLYKGGFDFRALLCLMLEIRRKESVGP